MLRKNFLTFNLLGYGFTLCDIWCLPIVRFDGLKLSAVAFLHIKIIMLLFEKQNKTKTKTKKQNKTKQNKNKNKNKKQNKTKTKKQNKTKQKQQKPTVCCFQSFCRSELQKYFIERTSIFWKTVRKLVLK